MIFFRIPVAQVELFHDQKWSCLKRGKNNYYLLDDLQNTTFPIEGRLTAVDGQVLGFSLEQNVVKDKNEVFLPTQFNSFHLGKSYLPVLIERQINTKPLNIIVV